MSVGAKREEFRKYLERSGVMDALTKILVSLYEETEKPTDALDYIRKNLGNIVDNTKEGDNIHKNLGGIAIVDKEGDNIDNLKKELEESKAKIAELKSKLLKYEQTKDEANVPMTE